MAANTPSEPKTQRSRSASSPARWQVRLLGAVEVWDGEQRVDRFPSRAVAALLARLALAPDQLHAREELVELLWPGVDLPVGRNRLRQALSALKSLLEPAGSPGSTVLQADRVGVRVVAGGLACDVVRFEALARAGQRDAAAALYRGPFMPGFFDDWIHEERLRLSALHDRLAAPADGLMLDGQAMSIGAPNPAPTPLSKTAVVALPNYLTRLFGADQVVARLRAQLRLQRLVTLKGPGGSGKTRLAVEVARALREGLVWAAEDAPFHRIAFVPLVSCEQASQVLSALMRALQLPPGGADDVARLVTALHDQRVLLVLDNCEQLVGQMEAVLVQLLGELPLLHLLCTSRRSLGLDGEVVVVAEPLGLPGPDVELAQVATNPAVALFVDRARAVRSDFHLSERNHRAVVSLVRLLQGMPLAIELAASRVRTFAPAQMLELLAGGAAPHLSLLARVGARAGHDPRHASMTQVIAWSWRLLEAPAQRLLGALSCFAADASVQALAGMLEEPLPAVAAQLDDLAGHSLLQVQGDELARFGLVEPVREFVRAYLVAAEAQTLQLALHRWVWRWARGLDLSQGTGQVAQELRTVHAVLANAALTPLLALQTAVALRSYWDTDALPAAQQLALENALTLAEPEPGLRSDAHEMLAYLRFEAGFVAQALSHADAALLAAENDPSRRARALVRRAWVDIATGRGEDKQAPGLQRLDAWLQEAVTLARTCADREAQARALHQMAVIASHHRQDWVGAEAMLAQSQALWLALGDRRKANARLRNRAQCWIRLGRRQEALDCFRQCERWAHEDGDWVGQIDSMCSLSSLLSQRREWAAALAIDQRCVALCWQRWHRHGLGYALWNPPRSLAHLRRPEAAMKLMAFAARFWETSFGALTQGDRQTVRRVRGLVKAQVGAAQATAWWEEGRSMTVAQAVALALQPPNAPV